MLDHELRWCFSSDSMIGIASVPVRKNAFSSSLFPSANRSRNRYSPIGEAAVTVPVLALRRNEQPQRMDGENMGTMSWIC